jgi:hypothetical protein
MPLSSTATLGCAILAIASYSKQLGSNSWRMETVAVQQI